MSVLRGIILVKSYLLAGPTNKAVPF